MNGLVTNELEACLRLLGPKISSEERIIALIRLPRLLSPNDSKSLERVLLAVDSGYLIRLLSSTEDDRIVHQSVAINLLGCFACHSRLCDHEKMKSTFPCIISLLTSLDELLSNRTEKEPVDEEINLFKDTLDLFSRMMSHNAVKKYLLNVCNVEPLAKRLVASKNPELCDTLKPLLYSNAKTNKKFIAALLCTIFDPKSAVTAQSCRVLELVLDGNLLPNAHVSDMKSYLCRILRHKGVKNEIKTATMSAVASWLVTAPAQSIKMGDSVWNSLFVAACVEINMTLPEIPAAQIQSTELSYAARVCIILDSLLSPLIFDAEAEAEAGADDQRKEESGNSKIDFLALRNSFMSLLENFAAYFARVYADSQHEISAASMHTCSDSLVIVRTAMLLLLLIDTSEYAKTMAPLLVTLLDTGSESVACVLAATISEFANAPGTLSRTLVRHGVLLSILRFLADDSIWVSVVSDSELASTRAIEHLVDALAAVSLERAQESISAHAIDDATAFVNLSIDALSATRSAAALLRSCGNAERFHATLLQLAQSVLVFCAAHAKEFAATLPTATSFARAARDVLVALEEQQHLLPSDTFGTSDACGSLASAFDACCEAISTLARSDTAFGSAFRALASQGCESRTIMFAAKQ